MKLLPTNIKVTKTAIILCSVLLMGNIFLPTTVQAKEITIDPPKVEVQEEQSREDNPWIKVIPIGIAAFGVGYLSGKKKTKNKDNQKVLKKKQ